MNSDSEDDFHDETQSMRQVGSSRSGQAAEGPPAKKVRGRNRLWVFVKSFGSHEEFDNWLTKDKSNSKQRWRKGKEHGTSEGVKRLYHCSQRNCKALMSVVYCSNSPRVEVHRSPEEHQHDTPLDWGLTPEIKQVIDDLYRDGVRKPLQIYNVLRSRSLKVRDKKQVDNYLKRRREKDHGPAAVSFNDLAEWCEEKSVPPEDPNQVYVLKHVIDVSLGRVCVVMSTKALQGVAKNAQIVHTDATYKLMWQGFPAILASVSDEKRQVFPVAFAVSSGETADDYEMVLRAMKEGVETTSGESFQPRVVVADAAEAITLAAERVFPQALRRVCWFHVRKSAEKYLRKENEIRSSCLADLRVLQLATSAEQFAQVSAAMLQKWELKWPGAEFPANFRRQWLDKNSAWYEGFDSGSPSTNNGLESFNSVIKRYTFRERLPVGQFLSFCEGMIKEWSLDCADRRPFQVARQPDTREFRDAWIYMQETATANVLVYGNTWYLASGGRARLTTEELNEYLVAMNACADFDQYAEQRMAVWAVEATEGADVRCNCPVGMKRGVCKHTIAVSVWDNRIEVPAVAQHSLVGQKRKRGRPSATATALMRQH